MRVSFSRSLLLVAVIGLIPAVAAAEEKKSDGKDPNRIICEKQEVLGSRLGSKRVCMTAAEWSVRREEQRRMIDRSQTQQNRPPGG